jgi:hypothetical protein
MWAGPHSALGETISLGHSLRFYLTAALAVLALMLTLPALLMVQAVSVDSDSEPPSQFTFYIRALKSS